MTRITCPVLSEKVTSAEEAANFINDGDIVGMSGFTGSGYPKGLPAALAEKGKDAQENGKEFGIELYTGASTATDADGVMAEAGVIRKRSPFQSDPALRNAINTGQTDYVDTHLSHLAQQLQFGWFGNLNVAVIEVAAIHPNGQLVPSSAVGNNQMWLDLADKVIIEVNEWQPAAYEGMHDVYTGIGVPPERKPLNINDSFQQIGTPYLQVDAEKVVAVVHTNAPDRNAPFKPADEVSKAQADHIVDFLRYEINQGRLPDSLFPIQSGVGNIANAVLVNLANSEFEGLTSYTEVIQDGMLDLIDAGKLKSASATSFALSAERAADFNANIENYKGRILLRNQDVSNHPEIIRRLGVIAINAMVEADIYGNVNSTHVMGSSVINGIGGSGDFTRNAYLNFFVSPSVAKDGAISTIVPFASHIDHTEHDTQVIVTEQGIADLRGLSPRKRAQTVIDKCAHPDYKDRLQDYFDRAMAANSKGQHTPHLMGEALSWHANFQQNGTM
ncbi:acetyl-CoA hydrolase/transferase family protein [Nesterenkonia sp. NBAIMH1]|uniref:acetyl-CoA hydrolase/transferase family protein n=1 Tax=Nesterenkonia sp. NBAIMH1 TaxID=2600320 RepID=UPI0011B4EC82|nr:acetyl-CoA hydrolase/transferase family protein [Nesterenkonia sp. NBAIMH1]